VALHPRAASKLADTGMLSLLGALTQQRIGCHDVSSVVRCVAAMERLTKASGSDEVAAAAVSTALDCLKALSEDVDARSSSSSCSNSISNSSSDGSSKSSSSMRAQEHAIVTACMVAQRGSEIQQRNAVKRRQSELVTAPGALPNGTGGSGLVAMGSTAKHRSSQAMGAGPRSSFGTRGSARRDSGYVGGPSGRRKSTLAGGSGGPRGSARRKSSLGSAGGSAAATAAAAATLDTCSMVLKKHAGSDAVATAVGKLLLTVNADAVPGLLETACAASSSTRNKSTDPGSSMDSSSGGSSDEVEHALMLLNAVATSSVGGEMVVWSTSDTHLNSLSEDVSSDSGAAKLVSLLNTACSRASSSTVAASISAELGFERRTLTTLSLLTKAANDPLSAGALSEHGVVEGLLNLLDGTVAALPEALTSEEAGDGVELASSGSSTTMVWTAGLLAYLRRACATLKVFGQLAQANPVLRSSLPPERLLPRLLQLLRACLRLVAPPDGDHSDDDLSNSTSSDAVTIECAAAATELLGVLVTTATDAYNNNSSDDEDVEMTVGGESLEDITNTVLAMVSWCPPLPNHLSTTLRAHAASGGTNYGSASSGSSNGPASTTTSDLVRQNSSNDPRGIAEAAGVEAQWCSAAMDALECASAEALEACTLCYGQFMMIIASNQDDDLGSNEDTSLSESMAVFTERVVYAGLALAAADGWCCLYKPPSSSWDKATGKTTLPTLSATAGASNHGSLLALLVRQTNSQSVQLIARRRATALRLLAKRAATPVLTASSPEDSSSSSPPLGECFVGAIMDALACAPRPWPWQVDARVFAPASQLLATLRNPVLAQEVYQRLAADAASAAVAAKGSGNNSSSSSSASSGAGGGGRARTGPLTMKHPPGKYLGYCAASGLDFLDLLLLQAPSSSASNNSSSSSPAVVFPFESDRRALVSVLTSAIERGSLSTGHISSSSNSSQAGNSGVGGSIPKKDASEGSVSSKASAFGTVLWSTKGNKTSNSSGGARSSMINGGDAQAQTMVESLIAPSAQWTYPRVDLPSTMWRLLVLLALRPVRSGQKWSGALIWSLPAADRVDDNDEDLFNNGTWDGGPGAGVGGGVCFGVLYGSDSKDGVASAVARVAAGAVLDAPGKTSKGSGPAANAQALVTVPALQLLGAALRDRRLDAQLVGNLGSATPSSVGQSSSSDGGDGSGSSWVRLASACGRLLRAGHPKVEHAAAQLLRAFAAASWDAHGAAMAAKAQLTGPKTLCRLTPGYAVSFMVDGSYGFGHNEGFIRQDQNDDADDDDLEVSILLAQQLRTCVFLFFLLLLYGCISQVSSLFELMMRLCNIIKIHV